MNISSLKLRMARVIAAFSALAAPVAASANPPGFGEEAYSAADLGCLSLAIYYEARSESDVGQQAVAQVVLNRVRDRFYPNDVCSVVFQGSERRTGCQFSFTCDGSMARLPEGRAWTKARETAAAVLAGRGDAPVGNATHYHTTAIHPYWAPSLAKVTTIGAHIFYSKHRTSEPPRMTFERVEQVVLSAVDPDVASEGARELTVSVHRGRASASR